MPVFNKKTQHFSSGQKSKLCVNADSLKQKNKYIKYFFIYLEFLLTHIVFFNCMVSKLLRSDLISNELYSMCTYLCSRLSMVNDHWSLNIVQSLKFRNFFQIYIDQYTLYTIQCLYYSTVYYSIHCIVYIPFNEYQNSVWITLFYNIIHFLGQLTSHDVHQDCCVHVNW